MKNKDKIWSAVLSDQTTILQSQPVEPACTAAYISKSCSLFNFFVHYSYPVSFLQVDELILTQDASAVNYG